MHDDWITQYVANWVFILEVCIVILLGIAWYFAENKKIKDHRQIVQLVLALQTAFISWMLISIIFTGYGKQFWPHAIIGIVVYLWLIYVYFSMSRRLPKKFSIPPKYRLITMKLTAVIWGFTVATGLFMYLLFPS